jgi:hypothetical protein
LVTVSAFRRIKRMEPIILVVERNWETSGRDI